MKIIDLFEEHEKEMAGEVLKYAVCDVRGRWFIGALEAIYSALIEELREAKAELEDERKREIYREGYAKMIEAQKPEETATSVPDSEAQVPETTDDVSMKDAARILNVNIYELRRLAGKAKVGPIRKKGKGPAVWSLSELRAVVADPAKDNRPPLPARRTARPRPEVVERVVAYLLENPDAKMLTIQAECGAFPWDVAAARETIAREKSENFTRPAEPTPDAEQDVERVRAHIKAYPYSRPSEIAADCGIDRERLSEITRTIATESVQPEVVQKPDEPFVAPDGFDQPKEKASGFVLHQDPAKPRTVDVQKIGYQPRILCLREMATSGNKSEAGRVSGLLPDDVDAIWFLYRQRLELLTETLDLEMALQNMLRHWWAKEPDPDSLPKSGKRSA